MPSWWKIIRVNPRFRELGIRAHSCSFVVDISVFSVNSVAKNKKFSVIAFLLEVPGCSGKFLRHKEYIARLLRELRAAVNLQPLNRENIIIH